MNSRLQRQCGITERKKGSVLRPIEIQEPAMQEREDWISLGSEYDSESDIPNLQRSDCWSFLSESHSMLSEDESDKRLEDTETIPRILLIANVECEV